MTDKKVQHFNVYGSVSAGTDERGRPQFKKGRCWGPRPFG